MFPKAKHSGGEMKSTVWYMPAFLMVIFYLYQSVPCVRGMDVDFGYHNYEDMTELLEDISGEHTDCTSLYSIGKSVEGKDIWVMVVSHDAIDEPLLKPNVKLVANIHGNEAVARELLIHLIPYLTNNYYEDDYIQWLLNTTRIHIMPTINPDGFESATEGECSGTEGKYNSRGFDLNSNFPDNFKTNNKQQQPETKAVRDWLDSTQFVLSGSFSGDELVARYPYDGTEANMVSSINSPSLTPDDDVFRHLASVYSSNHEKMHRGVPCRDKSPNFVNGTTNGAAWHPHTGGMQDYNYVWGGAMEVTLGISCCKFPPRAELEKYWLENRKSILQFLGQVHKGVKGIVKDSKDNPIPRAELKIRGREIAFYTTRKGEFWRILLPGSYVLEVTAEGYNPAEAEFIVTSEEATIQDIIMYSTAVVTELSESSTEEPIDKVTTIKHSLTTTAVPVVNPDDNAILAEIFTTDKVAEYVVPKPEAIDDKYASASKDEVKISVDLMTPTADTSSTDIGTLGRHLSLYCSFFSLISVFVFGRQFCL